MKTELLSPAGDMESLKTAIRFGADAVYCGGPLLQMRAEKAGFSSESLGKAIEYTHLEGRKIYVTVNSFAFNDEIPLVADYAKELYELGADAVIVADLGVLTAVKKAAPDLPVHISTQANCCNYLAAESYYNMGAERIVLAREMSIDEIAKLRAKTPKKLELEAFVHGAMCMAISGRCLISSFLNNRSGNRGECTQPCRWNYQLVEQKRQGEAFEINEDEGFSTILSSHDLNSISFIDKLQEAGITSFKIEGRMKTPYYVATVTNAYRRRLDNTTGLEELEAELLCASHRPFSRGFYFGELQKNHFNDGLYRQNCKFAGVVKAYKDGRLWLEQRNAFKEGDELEIISPKLFAEKISVTNIKNSSDEPVSKAVLVQELVSIDCHIPLEEGDILRIRKN